MKRCCIFFIGCLLSLSAFSQKQEFKVYSNGLIYSESAMSKLGLIVDSLNLKYRTCNLNPVYHSIYQTIGHIIKVDKEDIKKAKQDIKNQISWEDFLIKYPKTQVKRDVLVIRSNYTNYDKEELVEFSEMQLKSGDGFSITSTDLTMQFKDMAKQWLYQYKEKSSYSEESLSAFYFPSGFSTTVIPSKYAKMIGYADCLIDTNISKFKKDAKTGYVELPENWTQLSDKKKSKLLDDFRSTRVVGFCSMDNRPRLHAVNIALLSAETYDWSVFLKAHLDIMNDRFERVSDGSYAWGARNTYIKEIEDLNIDVASLLFGITFRMEDASANHYFGSIRRIGRALAESKNKEQLEQSMLSIMSDQSLDDYNRLLFYFLFLNYNNYVSDETIKQENELKLKTAVKTFPSYISERLKE